MLGLLAEAPALPLHAAGKYVAGAYIVFLVLIFVYVAIMAAKLQRIEKELRELANFAEQGGRSPTPDLPAVDPVPPSSDRDLAPSGASEGAAGHAQGDADV